jgi:gelsolin
VQYRETQGLESARFLSYFPHLICLHGGVASGFHHVPTEPGAPPPLKLYKVSIRHTKPTIIQAKPEGASLADGNVFILDKGTEVWQFDRKSSVGKERFKAAEFVRNLVEENITLYKRCRSTVYGPCRRPFFKSPYILYLISYILYIILLGPTDEGGQSAGVFASQFGLKDWPPRATRPEGTDLPPTLLRLSDATGTLTFEAVFPVAYDSLSSADAFLLDHSHAEHPSVYIWIGKAASLNERRLALQYAQQYLYNKQEAGEHGHVQVAANIVKMNEGAENDAFLQALKN